MSLQTLYRALRGSLCKIPGSPVYASALYHDKPRDKVKIAKLQEAERVEKQSAQEKYQPYKDLTPIEDIINLIRLQKNPKEAEAPAANLPVDSSSGLVDCDSMVSPFRKPQQKCIICKHDIELSVKNVRLLSQFVSPFTGRIYGASTTGLCIPMQRRVAQLINRARRMGLMPLIYKDPKFLGDPELFSPFKRS